MLGHKHEADAAHTSWLCSEGLSPEFTPVLWLLGFRQSHLHPCFPHKPSPDIPSQHFLFPSVFPFAAKGPGAFCGPSCCCPRPWAWLLVRRAAWWLLPCVHDVDMCVTGTPRTWLCPAAGCPPAWPHIWAVRLGRAMPLCGVLETRAEPVTASHHK